MYILAPFWLFTILLNIISIVAEVRGTSKYATNERTDSGGRGNGGEKTGGAKHRLSKIGNLRYEKVVTRLGLEPRT